MSDTKTYVCFYPSRPVWVDQAIDFSDPLLHHVFTERMSEVVHTSATDEVTVSVCRDGCFMISVAKLEALLDADENKETPSILAYWENYLNLINGLYLLLDSAMVEIENFCYLNVSEITSKDAFRLTLRNGKFDSCGIVTEGIAGVYQLARYIFSYGNTQNLEHEPRLSNRHILKLETIQHAIDTFLFMTKHSGCEKHLASYTKSLSEYKVGNFSTSIVLAWFIIESIANRLWREHLRKINRKVSGEKQRINSDRKKDLTGQIFTANITLNVLELMEIIDYPLFESLDECRRHRNKIAHTDGFSPNASNASLALKAAMEMIKIQWGLTFTPNLSYSVSY